MSQPLRILLLAEEGSGIAVLRKLMNSRYEVVAVMASPNTDGAAGATMWDMAGKLNCDRWPASELRDAELPARIRAARIDLLLCVRFPRIVPDPVLAAPKIGAYNLHTGPLPEYAGINVVSWAIYNGETVHGATLHRMVAEVDRGDIAYQDRFPIADGESAARLTQKTLKHGLLLVEQLLSKASMEPGDIPIIPQDPALRNVYQSDPPHDGWLQWNRPAAEIVNLVRACDYFPFPSPWGQPANWDGDRVLKVLKAETTGRATDQPPGSVGEVDGDRALVAAADQWVAVTELSHGDDRFAAGEALRPGMRLDRTAGRER